MVSSARFMILFAAALLMLLLFGSAQEAWAAPRESIVYKDGGGGIFRVSPDGIDQLMLARQASISPVRSIPFPDGYSIISFNTENQYIVSAPDGSAEMNRSSAGFTYSAGFALSPDGTQIAFAGRSTQTYNVVHVMNADGTGLPVALTSSIRHQNVLHWGSAGILYRSLDSVELAYPLWVVEPGSLAITRLSPANFNVVDARYSPDNSRIVMVGQYAGVSGGNRIFVMNADGSGLTEVSTNPVMLVPNSVAWASDGSTRIAVSARPSDSTSIWQIYQVDLSTGAVTEVMESSGGGTPNYVYWGPLEDPKTPTQLTLTNAAGGYSDPVTLQATLTSGGTGMGSRLITFSVDGTVVGTGTTNSSGVASFAYIIEQPAGAFTLLAEFEGDTLYGGSVATSQLDVTPEDVTLLYTGDLEAGGGSLSLSALLTEQADGFPGDLSNAGAVEFTLRLVSDNSVVGLYTAAVQADGSASVLSGPVTNEPHTVDAVLLLPHDYYTADPTSAIVRMTTATTTDAAAGQHSDLVTLTATLSPAVAGKSIEFRIGPTLVGTATTDGLGVATQSYVIAVPVGAHQIRADFAGDLYLTAATDTDTLTVTHEQASLSYTGSTVADGGPFTLQATLAEELDPTPGDITRAGTVEFQLYYQSDGILAGTYSALGAADGTATVDLASLAARSYDVDLILLPNDYYVADPVSTVIQTQPMLTVNDQSVQYSDTVLQRAVLSADGGGLSGRTITFSVDGAVVGSAVTDATGEAVLSHTVVLPAGSYAIDASFDGDGSFVAVAGSGTLGVMREQATLAYTGDTLTAGGTLNLSATMTEEADPTPGDTTLAGSIRFEVRALDGTLVDTQTVVVQPDGTAATSSVVLPNQPYSVSVSLLANDYYIAGSVTAGVRATTSLAVDDQSGSYSDSLTLTATLTPAAASKSVAFAVEGSSVGSAMTDAAGVASRNLVVRLPTGSYVIAADFAGDADYTAASGMGTLTVTHEQATLAYTGDTATAGGELALSASVTEVADPWPGDITLAGTVRFEIRTLDDTVVDTQTAAVQPDGTAAATSAPLASQPYTVAVSLEPGDYYTADPVSVTIRAAADLTVDAAAGQYSDTVMLVATLTDANGGVDGHTVTIFVDGVSAGTAVTNAAGGATVAYLIDLPTSTYSIDAEFAGDAYYSPAAGAAMLTVDREQAALAYTGDTQSGNNVALTLSANLTEEDDGMPGDLTLAGTVEFTLTRASDGVLVGLYTAAVAADGTAVVVTEELPGYTYQVTVRLLPNGYYEAADVTASLQGMPVLEVDDASGQYSDEVTLRALLHEDGLPLSGRSVTFSAGGVVVATVTTDGSGVATVTYGIALPAGSHLIDARFPGDGFYPPTDGTGTLTVTHEQATLDYTGPTVTAGGALALSATLTEEADPTPGDITLAGSVRFEVRTLDGTLVETQTAFVQADGTASVTTAALPNEPYNVIVNLEANGYYSALPVSAKVQATTDLDVDDLSGQYSDSVTLTATLSPAASGKSITFTVDGTAAGSATTDAAGVATVSYSIALAAGSYVITADFAGDADYTAASGTGALTVTREQATLAYTGDTTATGGTLDLSATLTEELEPTPGDITLAGSVRFELHTPGGVLVDTQLAAVQPDGTAAATSAALPAQPYTVTVSLEPNGYYSATPVFATVRAEATLTVDPASVQYSDTVTLTATLTDGGGGVAGQMITFTVDGAVAGSGVTDAAGVASLSYSTALVAGSYVITADFAGDAYYSPATDSDTLSVTHESATMDYTGDTIADGGAFTLQASLTEELDPTPGDITLAESVEFRLYYRTDGTLAESHTAAVAADGTATVNLAALAARSYDVEIELLPNSYYSAAPATAVIQTVAVLQVDDASRQYSDTVTLRAVLTADGGGVSGRTVTFTVDGSPTGSGVTDAVGVATVDYTTGLPAGSYVIAADFAGDETYTAASDTRTLTVTHEQATLAYTGPTVTAGGALALSATLTEEADPTPGDITFAGDIKFAVYAQDGTVVGAYAAAIQPDGSASVISDPLPNEPYTVEAGLQPNGYYAAVNQMVNVQATANLEVDDGNGQYSDSVTLRAALNPADSGKSITFTVDGTAAGSGVTDAAGVATVSYSIALPTGSYAIVADFAGDADYTAAAGTGTLTVTREQATLAYTGDTTATGGTLDLSATLTEEADSIAGDITLAGSVRFEVYTPSGILVDTQVAAIQVDGTASATSSLLSAQPYTVTVSLEPNVHYSATAVSATVRTEATLTVDPAGAQYSDTVTLTATLTDGGGGVAGQTITFTVDGAAVGSGVTDAAGVASLSYSTALAAGSYVITADFAGDAYYSPATDSDTLSVTHESATMDYTGDTIADGGAFTLQASLTEELDPTPGDITLAESVEFRLYYRTDGTLAESHTAAVAADGTATVNLAALVARAYDLTVSLLPNGYYVAAPIAAIIETQPVVTVADATGQHSDDVLLEATLTEDGVPISGKSLTFTVDGVVVGTATTDALGAASLVYSIQQPVGTLTVEARYAGEPGYAAADGSATLTVLHETATLAYTGDTLSSGGPLALSATLTEEADPTPGAIENAGTVQFLIRREDGTVADTQTAAVQPDGTASATSASLPAAPYDLEISLLTNGYYEAAPIADRIRAAVTLTVDDVTGQYSDDATLRVQLSPAVAGKSIVITVGAWSTSVATDGSGEATAVYTITQGVGTLSIDAEFTGDADYAASSATGTLTVEHENLTLTYTGQTVTVGGSLALTALVEEEADPTPGNIVNADTVQFTVRNLDGTAVDSQTATVQADGTAAATSASLPLEPYRVEVSLLSNDYYQAPVVIANVQAITSLTADDQSGEYSDGVTLRAVLSPGAAGMSIAFTVDGVEVGTATTDAAGEAILPYTIDLPTGSYVIQADFAGDDDYAVSSDTAQLTVAKESSTVVYTGDTAVSSGAFTLSAQVTQEADGSPGDLTLTRVRWRVTRNSDGTVTDYFAYSDANGSATYVIPDLPVDGYSIRTEIDPDNGYFTSPADSLLIRGETTLSLNDAFVIYSDQTTLTATLLAGSTALAGKTVAFAVNGVAVGTAVTDAAGVASLDWTNVNSGAQPAGLHSGSLEAAFPGDSDFEPADAPPADLTVAKESAAVAYTGQTDLVGTGSPQSLTLSALVEQEADGFPGDITLAEVQWTLTRADGTVLPPLSDAIAADGTASGVTSVENFGYSVRTEVDPANGWFTGLAVPDSIIRGNPLLTVAPVSLQYSDSTSFTATLSAGGTALAGRTVAFDVDINDGNGFVERGTAVTDASGTAIFAWANANWNPITAPPWTVRARVVAEIYFNAAMSDAVTVTLLREDGLIHDIRWRRLGASANYHLWASFTEVNDGLLGNQAGAPVSLRFEVGNPSTPGVWLHCGDVTQTPTGTPATTGELQVNCTNGVGSMDGWTLRVSLLANNYFTAPATIGPISGATGTMTVSDTSGTFGEETTLTASFDESARTMLLAAVTSTDAGLSLRDLFALLAARPEPEGKWGAPIFPSGGGSPIVPPGIVGKPVHFFVDGQLVGEAPIGADGRARLTYRITLPAGQYRVDARFMGHATHGPASGSGTLTVQARRLLLTYTGDQESPNGKLQLQARATDSAGSVVTFPEDVAVRFVLRHEVTGSASEHEAPVESDGVATLVLAGVPAGVYTLHAFLEGGGYFWADPVSEQIRIGPGAWEVSAD